MRLKILTALIGTLTLAGIAHAGEKCDVPDAEWQPREALAGKLKAMGWDVRSLKTEDGCYEVYAVDAKGSKIEAHFNPKTLEPVGSDKEDEG
ncbi:PepSY domain-containing protein [Nordella sp. HKS 07]|uniref:PepSY domain-containing protein n=1 Tax=Nordella sp. HKS 07 TaxID=2712222 RepID=UPI0013E11911|nr:PepSY domain-containing protein [Nordella sp. HKS 07]QIG50298.1 PepSY domain-containing protein [Nordella sp. HKS 07]